MNTELESSQRNHLASETKYPQCPNCRTANPKRYVTYRHPQTGMYKSAKGLNGCLFWIIAYVAIGLLTDFLIVLPILFITGKLFDPLYGDVGMIAIPIAVVGASIALPLFRVRREDRLNKTHLKIEHFTCRHCKERWDVVQEPPAKELS